MNERVRPSENPFRSGAIDALGFRWCEGWDQARFVKRLEETGWRGAIVGPHGYGKTTLMMGLMAGEKDVKRWSKGNLAGGDVSGIVYLKVDADQLAWGQVLKEIHSYRGMVFLDGYDLLPWWYRWRLLRRKRGIVVTSHRETRLPTLYRCETTTSGVRELLRELSKKVCEQVDDVELTALIARHGGNVRDVWRELYDRVGCGEFEI